LAAAAFSRLYAGAGVGCGNHLHRRILKGTNVRAGNACLAQIALAVVLGVVVQAACAQHADRQSAQIRQRTAAGDAQDFIVVFDDRAIREDAAQFLAAAGLPANHPRVIERKAQGFSAQKRRALAGIAADDIALLRDYRHLPISDIRIGSHKALEKLRARPGVVGVYANGFVHRLQSGVAQNLALVGQPQAAAAGDLGAGTTVAVIDERVDFTQPAFGSCTAPGVPASGCKVAVAQDIEGVLPDGLGFQDGHGTNVAAIALGVAPGSRIISLNVFYGGVASDAEIIGGIDWCIANASAYNIVAINMSLGDNSQNASAVTDSPYYYAFANAQAAGMLPVAAAGNGGFSSGIGLPAAVEGAVSVGAVYDISLGPISIDDPPLVVCSDPTTAADQVTCFSDSASNLTLFAPGCPITAAGITFCGTSQAAPHVAGAIAVLRAAFPGDSLTQTIARLTDGVEVTDVRNGIIKPRLSLPIALGLEPCAYAVSTSSVTAGPAAASANIARITTANGCSWSATSNVNWISIISDASGIGSANLEYQIQANPGAYSRSGTLTAAGQTITVTQASSGTAQSGASNIWLYGADTYQTDGLTSATVDINEIYNSSATTTGSLRLDFWVSPTPFYPGVGVGYRAGSYLLGPGNGTLGPEAAQFSISANIPLVDLPPPGKYFATLVVDQNYSNPADCASSDHFCEATYYAFANPVVVPDVTAPSVPTRLIATAVSSGEIDLAWSNSTDDVGVVSYPIYVDGVSIGKALGNGAPLFGFSPSTNYQFSVSACDVAGNCSAQSAAATATTPGLAIQPAAGYWWNPAEPGRGFVIEIQASKLFMAGFLYSASGEATWVASTGPMSSATQYSGALFTDAGGQTLTGAYKGPPTSTAALGTISIDFTSASQATLTWPGGSVPIRRFDIVAGGSSTAQASSNPQTGWWWNPAESGRGFAIEVQNGVIWLAGYMYDASGTATWYLADGNMSTNASTSIFQGEWVQFGSGQTLKGAFQPATLANPSAGTVTLQFGDTTNATLTLPDGRQIALTRFSF